MAIRLLHVAEAAGGVERYLELLLKYSPNNEVENILICSQHFNTEKIKNYAKVNQIEMSHKFDLKIDLRAISEIRKYIKTYLPDLVYAHSTKAGALVRIACLGLPVPVLYNPHGWAFNMGHSNLKKTAYKFIEKVQNKFTKRYILISQAEKESALKSKITDIKKISVIDNGIDFDEFKAKDDISREKLGIPKNAFVIGQVGRLVEQKSPDVFVKAAKLVKENIPNSFFVLVGNGDQESYIRELIRREGLGECCIITGWVENPVSYMKLFDVGTLLSRWEGFGLVLAEYMYSKVPIVATKIDAIPYVVEDRKDGLLVNKDSVAAVAQAIMEIHDNKKLAEELIDNGYEKAVKKYDGRRVSTETTTVYKEVMGGSIDQSIT